jgi:hypothetical protein
VKLARTHTADRLRAPAAAAPAGRRAGARAQVRVTLFEIYNEQVRDLLVDPKLQAKHNPRD